MTEISRDNKKYSFCIGLNCKNHNTVLVKRVYNDLLYLPFCMECIKEYRFRINKIFNNTEFIKKIDVANIYFKNLGMIK